MIPDRHVSALMKLYGCWRLFFVSIAERPVEFSVARTCARMLSELLLLLMPFAPVSATPFET